MSKGSSPRPFSVSDEEYATRWDAIFGRVPTENDLAQQALQLMADDAKKQGLDYKPVRRSCNQDGNQGLECPCKGVA